MSDELRHALRQQEAARRALEQAQREGDVMGQRKAQRALVAATRAVEAAQ